MHHFAVLTPAKRQVGYGTVNAIKPQMAGDCEAENSMPFKILDCPLVLFSLLARCKRTQVLALARLRVLMSRINPKLTRLQFTNHYFLLGRISPDCLDR
jgi:hypothetical protein